ncbi:hypothetical protein [Haloplanus natans]|uniref:hypothetical protein n=1 Tax=Haloplanus natans TaxID=376171 RepID=UPI0006776E72|nr:hypothetical protein [Haloplanus natans]
MSDDQSRLQEYGDVGAPPVEETGPVCERCGEDLDEGDTKRLRVGPAEYETGYYDINRPGTDKRRLCDDCEDLEKYLGHRYKQITERTGADDAVAVFCECHDDDEVDVQPVRHGDTLADIRCSNCGSAEVLVEELPPDASHGWGVRQ